MARDLLDQAQLDLQDLAKRLTDEQRHSEEERARLEQQERELQARLEAEIQTAAELKVKLEQLNSLHINSCQTLFRDILPSDELEKSSLIYEEVKCKEEMMENEEESNLSEPEQNHINLTVSGGLGGFGRFDWGF